MPRDKILYSAFIFKAAHSIHFTAIQGQKLGAMTI